MSKSKKKHLKLKGGNDCGCEVADTECHEVCNMLSGGGRFNRKIGGEQDLAKECADECDGNDECIEGCDLMMSGGNLTSKPLKLKGGNEPDPAIIALCDSGETGMDRDECIEMLS